MPQITARLRRNEAPWLKEMLLRFIPLVSDPCTQESPRSLSVSSPGLQELRGVRLHSQTWRHDRRTIRQTSHPAKSAKELNTKLVTIKEQYRRSTENT
jgi:hypothetical protein